MRFPCSKDGLAWSQSPFLTGVLGENLQEETFP